METRTQLSVWLANEPGVLADLLKSLAAKDINVLGLSVQDSCDHAIIRFLPDRPTHAIHLLEDEGTTCYDSEVLYFELANRPGSFLQVCEALSEVKVNINYTYGCAGPGGEPSWMVLRPSNLERARQALEKLGL